MSSWSVMRSQMTWTTFPHLQCKIGLKSPDCLELAYTAIMSHILTKNRTEFETWQGRNQKWIRML